MFKLVCLRLSYFSSQPVEFTLNSRSAASVFTVTALRNVSLSLEE